MLNHSFVEFSICRRHERMSSTSLASQLNALKAASTTASSQKKLASFLYEPKVAAKIDLRTTFEHAKQALNQLSSLDGALDVYETSLLDSSKAQAQFNRALLTKDENTALDAEIAAFLDALSPYFLLPPTHQVLEYMIRRYEIHTWNVEQILAMTLCYHESPVFARLITICDLAKAGQRWSFLEPVKTNNVPLLRANLAKRCFTDPSIVRFIYDAARRIGSKNTKVMALYTLLAMEILDKSKLTDQILRWVLPNVLEGLRDRTYAEHQLASYMIATKLAAKSTLAHAARTQIVVAIAKSAPAHAQLDALLALVSVVQTQPFEFLPVDSVKHILHYDDVPQLIRDAMDAYDTRKFLELFFASLAQLLPTEPAVENVLSGILAELGSEAAPFVGEIVRHLLVNALKNKDGATDSFQQVLRHISKRYAEQIDAGLNALLDSTTDEEDKAFFVSFAAKTFDGSSTAALHVPLAQTGLSLLLSLDHPSSDFRIHALKAVSKLKLDATPEADVLLRRLNDDDPAVIKQALKSAGALLLDILSPVALLDAIAYAVNHRANDSHFQEAIVALLKFVTGPFLAKFPNEHDVAVLDILLVFAPSKWVYKTPDSIVDFTTWVELLQQLHHPFGKALKKAPKDLAAVALSWSSVLTPELIEIVQTWAEPSAYRRVAKPFLAMQVLFAARKKHPETTESLLSLIRKEWTTEAALHRSALNQVVEMICAIMTHDFASRPTDYDDAVSMLLHSPASRFDSVQPFLHDKLAAHGWTSLLHGLTRLVHRVETHPTATVRSLALLTVMLECHHGPIKMADFHQVLLTLVVAMNSTDATVRRAAVQGVKPLSKIAVDKHDRAALAPYHKALSALGHAKAEVVMDGNYILTLCHHIVDEQKLDATWVKQILSTALSSHGEAFTKTLKQRAARVLDVLALVSLAGVWEATLPWFTQHVQLEDHTEDDFKVLTGLLTHYLTSWTKPPKAVIDAVRTTLTTTQVPNLHKHIAVTMPVAWYAGLSHAQQSAIATALVQLMRSGEDVSEVGSELLPRLQIGADIVAKLLQHDKSPHWVANVTCVLEVVPALLPAYVTSDLDQLLTPLQNILVHFCQDHVSEYSVQMVLTVLHETCSRIPKAPKGKASHAKTLVELTINVVQATMSPQTRNAALLFVSSLVELYPSQVLASLVPILTHASNVHMDDYSFHVLQEIVHHAVPHVTAADSPVSPQQFLQTFVAAFGAIPDARRADLFHLVVSALAKEKSNALGLALILLLNSMGAATEEIRTAFCHELASRFSPEAQIDALVYLVQASGHLQDNDSDFDFDTSIVTDETVTYVLSFVPLHLSQKTLHHQILDEQDEPTQLQESYLLLAQALLLYLQRDDADIDLAGFAMDGMHNLQQLLTAPGFVAVIGELLRHDDSRIRRRALQLLNERIEANDGTLTPEEELLFVDMVSELSDVLKNDGEASLMADIQMALLSVDVLTRFFAKKHPKTFLAVLPSVLATTNHSNTHVVGSAFVCLSNLALALGPAVFPYVPKFFPTLLSTLETSLSSSSSEDTQTLQQCCMVALRNFTATFPQFLVPYLPRMFKLLFSPELKHPQVRLAVEATLSTLAQGLETRNLLPIFVEMYPLCCGHGEEAAIELFGLVSTVVSSMDRPAIKTHLTGLMRFFLMALDVLRIHSHLPDSVQEKLLDAFMVLVLKLSEKQLKPLFLKLVSWVDMVLPGEDAPNLVRQAIFYRLVVRLSDQLRSIFVPYYAHILPQCAAICAWELEEDSFFQRPTKKQKTAAKAVSVSKAQVVETVAHALVGCFLHDTDGFMDKEKFDEIMPSLVDLLDQAESHPAIVAHAVQAIAHLAWAAKNDILWKPMHHRILMKSRNDDASVRLAALQAIEACYSVVGEEFLAMLPESIPFLAELLEDSDSQVETLCHKVIKQIEEISGESLDQYLTA
ncbi:unnamed protein product [Aphanomyces euteiches]